MWREQEVSPFESVLGSAAAGYGNAASLFLTNSRSELCPHLMAAGFCSGIGLAEHEKCRLWSQFSIQPEFLLTQKSGEVALIYLFVPAHTLG